MPSGGRVESSERERHPGSTHRSGGFQFPVHSSKVRFSCWDSSGYIFFFWKFGYIPLKDHHFGSIPLLSHLHVSPHESMTCGIHGIYLKFGSFNGIDPIVFFFFFLPLRRRRKCGSLSSPQ
jgi:hypothetical protein